MAYLVSVLFVAVAVAVAATSLSLVIAQRSCPPEGFDSVADLNLTKYAAAPWYVQEQMVNSYQPEEELFCVRAKYTAINPQNIQAGFLVQNYRNRGGVNLSPGGSSGAGGSNCSFSNRLLAFPVSAFNNSEASSTDGSKLLVGPAPVAALHWPELLGDYWVVAVGVSDNDTLGYDWAIISAGPPEVNGTGGCRTGTEQQQQDSAAMNGVGLWLFSRQPEDAANTEVMKKVAQDLGYDTSVLVPVQQQGCKYVDADSTCPTLNATAPSVATGP